MNCFHPKYKAYILFYIVIKDIGFIFLIAMLINIIFDFIKSGLATDEQGYPTYQGYLDYYDSL